MLDRIGPYRIEGRLGAGGMGEVYRAHDERLDRPVAIKVVRRDLAHDPERRERLRREARASARLNHPAVVQVYDIVEGDGFDGIVMELVEGRTLWKLVREGPLPVARAVALGREVASALAAAHERGIVHRDLKSENVLVTPAGQAKVLDFGLAKRLDQGEEASLTADGVVLGTCRSMAPEQVEGREADPRGDLFSLGVLLYEAATGRSPFLAATVTATLSRVATHRQRAACRRNPRVPQELSDLVDHLLEKDPARRPASALEVAAALEAIAAALPPEVPQAAGMATGSTATASAAGPSTGLARPGATARLGSAQVRPVTGERRQVTVLRCDLTAPGGGPLDAEELLESQPLLREIAGEVVARWEGRLGPVMSPEPHAYFGVPRAQEDDARRAVHAALEIVERFAQERPGAGVRVGLHTGPVVVSRGGGALRDELAAGETASLAGAALSLASPGTVLLSTATHRLVENFFACAALPPAQHPASARPLALFRVLESTGATGRLDRSDGIALTPLVAREEELELLLSRWRLAREGKGQAVLLGGEAGLGKSRLVRELKVRVAPEEHVRLECAGSPYHRDTALFPIVEMLRRLVERERQELPAERLARLEELLGRHGLPLAETMPLFAALLGLPVGERWPPLGLSPEAQRRRTREAVLALLLEMAERRPVLLAVEDLHWVDPSSLDLLGELIEQAATARLFILLTFRPEFDPPWGQRSHRTQLTLSPLSSRQVEELVERMAARLAHGQALPRQVVEQLVDKTDGVPLAVEELTRMVLESGLLAERPGGLELARPLAPLSIPETLRDSLAARLDRLDSAREVAQLAAALGREFPAEVLRAVAPWDEEFLDRQLDRLVKAELLYRRGLPPRVRYVFKHALIRDAAYDSLLRSQRQSFHARIAATLAERFPEMARHHPEVVAHHAAAAGMTVEAIDGWQRAAERSIRDSAYREALGHLNRALDLLKTLPESPERDRREIPLLIAYGVAAGRTVAGPELHHSYDRALELSEAIGPTPQTFQVLRGAYIFHLVSGRSPTARELALRLLRLGEETGERFHRLTAHQSMGFALLMEGDFGRAREHLEAGLALHDPEAPPADMILPGGGDPEVECLANLCWTLWFLGLPAEAERRVGEAIALAERRAHPFPLGFARYCAAELAVFRRDVDTAARWNGELLALAAEQDFHIWTALGTAQRGWISVAQGRPEEGLRELDGAIAAVRKSRMMITLPQHLALAADARLRLGDAAGGLAVVEEGFAAIAGGERLIEAELWRLRGELKALAGAPEEEVGESLARAAEVARKQGARALEQRIARSVARLGPPGKSSFTAA